MIAASVLCMAAALYHEARSEPPIGQYAIAHVIENRTKDGSFPDNVCDVVSWAETDSNGKIIQGWCSFHFFCDGKPEIIDDPAAYARAVAISIDVLMGDTPDITGGALWYASVDSGVTWGHYRTITVYNHRFFTRKF